MSVILGKIIAGFLFVLIPGFTLNENIKKHPFLSIASIIVGFMLLAISIVPLLESNDISNNLSTINIINYLDNTVNKVWSFKATKIIAFFYLEYFFTLIYIFVFIKVVMVIKNTVTFIAILPLVISIIGFSAWGSLFFAEFIFIDPSWKFTAYFSYDSITYALIILGILSVVWFVGRHIDQILPYKIDKDSEFYKERKLQKISSYGFSTIHLIALVIILYVR